MALPLVIAGAAGVVAGVASAASATKPFVVRLLKRHQSEIEEWALKEAFEAAGLPDLANGSPTREDLNAVINEKFLAGTGIELTNIFDRKAIRDDLEKIAYIKAAEALGVELKSKTREGMKEALREWVRGQVEAQISEGGGDLIEGARDVARVLAVIKAYREVIRENNGQAPERPGLLMTPEAISNRERQARYRAKHRKKWVPRG